MKGLRKRITCILCALLLSITALLSHPLKVEAASAAVSTEASTEALMLLLDLLITGMAASGTVEAVGNYDSEAALLDAFLDFVSTAAGVPESPLDDFIAQTTDGQTITLQDLVETHQGAMPDEETWQKYAFVWQCVMLGLNNSGSQEPEDPKQEPENPFTNIQHFAITSGMLTMISDFLGSVFNGEVEGVAPESVFTFDNMIYYGNGFEEAYFYSPMYKPDGSLLLFHNYVFTSDKPLCIYFTQNVQGVNYYTVRYFNGSMLCSVDSSIKVQKFDKDGNDYIITGLQSFQGPYSGTRTDGYKHLLETNMLVFDSYNSALAYYKSGDRTGLLNGECFDYPELIGSVPETLAPLTGINLAPSSLPGLNTAIGEAVAPYPVPGLEPDANTEQLKDTVKDTIIGNLPVTQPDIGSGGEPDVEPEPEPGTSVGGGGEPDYTVDLTDIFPFCLPFDFMALLQVLDAEPQTPYFEIPFVVPSLNIDMSVALDLAFLDDVMDGLRKLELVGFIVFLIFATGKVIKW